MRSKAAPLPLLDIAIWAGLIVAIFAVYAQVSHFDFVSYDDPDYVYDNVHAKAGLARDSIQWAFTSVAAANWMPVTLLSHMLDCHFFGMESGMHHLENVLFHMLASILLYTTLQRATGARGPSAFVAFVFALHPLHVESVAWVSERKDVLSAVFWFLALYAYVRYCEAPGLRSYLLVVAPFCLGLLSKPMLVTFPFTLLLFDVWPLRRAQLPKTLWEKLPLFALSAAASAVTFFVQRSQGAVASLPFALRVENALTSYTTYIGEMFWPSGLAFFYVLPDSVPAWKAASALAILLGISALAVLMRRTRPYFITGWLWYLGTLVPVIGGVVQVGLQSHADRYMYLPMVGLLWILGWGAKDLIEKWPRARTAIVCAAVVACVACGALSWKQAGYWRDSVALYQRAVDVTADNGYARLKLAGAHYDLGCELMNSGQHMEAASHFEEALRVRPNYPAAQNDFGVLFTKMPGHSADAIAHFEAALLLDPKLTQAHRNLGMILAAIPGKATEAISHLKAAQRVQPDPELQRMIQRLQAEGK